MLNSEWRGRPALPTSQSFASQIIPRHVLTILCSLVPPACSLFAKRCWIVEQQQIKAQAALPYTAPNQLFINRTYDWQCGSHAVVLYHLVTLVRVGLWTPHPHQFPQLSLTAVQQLRFPELPLTAVKQMRFSELPLTSVQQLRFPELPLTTVQQLATDQQEMNDVNGRRAFRSLRCNVCDKRHCWAVRV